MQDREIKLVALDVDGTIIGRNRRISYQTKNAVKQAGNRGVLVLIATGRMYRATVPIGHELQLSTPLITYHGALVKNFYKSDNVLLHHTIDSDVAYQIVEDSRRRGVQVNVYLNDRLYVERTSFIFDEYVHQKKIPYNEVKSFYNIENFSPTKILIMDADRLRVEKLNAEFSAKYSVDVGITTSGPHLCEFISRQSSKANAIRFLSNKWHIDHAEIMAIGDHCNDKELFEFAGCSIAMGNSDKVVKDIADYVTETLENDGAALAIKRFVL
ncbi:MAG: HAD family hydrolase [Candidatus Thiosymbion ectosymbiont of Robbea hypermnestra]|nr:HAD family hydrolase [Candidatus Thiosymbion ectosymbiont of Robbea hypermnestra]